MPVDGMTDDWMRFRSINEINSFVFFHSDIVFSHSALPSCILPVPVPVHAIDPTK